MIEIRTSQKDNMTLNKIIKSIAKYISIGLVGIPLVFALIWITNLMYSNAVDMVISNEKPTTSQVSTKESLIDSRMAALTARLNEYVIKEAKDRDDIVSSTKDLLKWPVEDEKEFKYKLFEYKKANTEINFIRLSKSENHFSNELCLKYNTPSFCKENGFDNPEQLRTDNDIEFYTSVLTSGDKGMNINIIKDDIAIEKDKSGNGTISHEKILEIFNLPNMN